ncbi:MAG: hypothetical protein JSV04_11985 [Candidatus Heimdallarchaeota archaeon]|nr:MAG: hypothetical protein JSV04_11985 [Candidatus Heimdallarchaeota archaeon]
MQKESISKDDIQQLLFFMNRIQAFEKTFLIQKESIIRLIWGLFLMGAGILDYVIYEMTVISEVYGLQTLLPWVLAIFSGLIIQLYSDRHLVNIYSWKKEDPEKNTNTLFLITGFVIMAIVITFFSSTDLYYLTFPFIALISGFMSLVGDRDFFQKNKDIFKRNFYLFTPVICVGAALLMLLVSWMDPEFIKFHGAIFGISFGGSFGIIAFWNRIKVEEFFEQTEVTEGS